MSSFHDRLWEKLRCPDSGSARIAREFVAEVVGTFLLVGFGDGAVASVRKRDKIEREKTESRVPMPEREDFFFF